MTNKAYIVANEQQESELLEKLEREGYLWRGTDMRPTEKHRLIDEPITIFARDDKRLTFDYGVNESYLADYEIEIDFDGRKEQQMSEKYVVSQEFMNELEEWKDYCFEEYDVVINSDSIEDLPIVINAWWGDDVPYKENNNRLIAILRWVNGEDVFEVEKPKKWVVRSMDIDGEGDYGYIFINPYNITISTYSISQATRFDTKEEAESWANAHQEVLEVVDV